MNLKDTIHSLWLGGKKKGLCSKYNWTLNMICISCEEKHLCKLVFEELREDDSLHSGREENTPQSFQPLLKWLMEFKGHTATSLGNLKCYNATNSWQILHTSLSQIACSGQTQALETKLQKVILPSSQTSCYRRSNNPTLSDWKRIYTEDQEGEDWQENHTHKPARTWRERK